MSDAPAATRGFTLIELMVTLAVAAVLITVAVPNFRMFMVNNRLASQANDLITALSVARSEAVKRGGNVTVCASSDGATCTGTWAQGWIVRDAGGVIQVQRGLSGSSTLSGGTNVASTLTYTPNGRTTIPASATAATTTLTLCPPSPAIVNGRAIQVERTGRARVSTITTCP